MGGAEDVGIGRVRLLGGHAVVETGLRQVRRHLRPPAQLVDECLVEPRFVDAQFGIGQQAVAVEPLDVVALEGAAIAPDVDVVLPHRGDEHRAGDGPAQGRRVEVGDPRRRDVEGAALERRQPFRHQLRAAIDQPGFLGTVRKRPFRNIVVIRLVGLTKVGRECVGNRAVRLHPGDGGAGVQTAGKRDADVLTDRQRLQNVCHGSSPL